MSLDPTIVRQQIENLRIAFPEIEHDEEAWLLSLESETDLDALLSSLVERLDDATVMSAGIEQRLAELSIRAERIAQRQRSLREAMLKLMQAAGVRKKELPLATLSVTKGRERLVIMDDEAVPDVFCRIKREPDKARIKEHLADIGSVLNWAHLETGEPSLSVRTK